MNIQEYVRQLRALHEERDAVFHPNGPATESDLSAAELAIGFQIGDGLKDLWRTCNGAAYWATFFGVVSDEPTPCRFLSVAEAVDNWRERRKLTDEYEQEIPRDERIASGWNNLRWLPFAEFNGFSTSVMYDRAPGFGGADGQIIVYQHDPDAINWVAESFLALLGDSLEIIRREGFAE